MPGESLGDEFAGPASGGTSESPAGRSVLLEFARAKEHAEAFVRAQLANGPRHGELVKRNAAEAEISERFLIAAADRLGVRWQGGQWWLPG